MKLEGTITEGFQSFLKDSNKSSSKKLEQTPFDENQPHESGKKLTKTSILWTEAEIQILRRIVTDAFENFGPENMTDSLRSAAHQLPGRLVSNYFSLLISKASKKL